MDKYHDSRKAKFHRNGVPKIIKDDRFKPEFHEDIENLQNVDPLFQTVNHFDYEAVFAAFGEGPGDAAIHYAEIAGHLGHFLSWLIEGEPKKGTLRKIGRRAVLAKRFFAPEVGVSRFAIAKIKI